MPVTGKSWLRVLDGDAAPRWGWAETMAMLLWCALVVFAVRQHVPWDDEAQAWMLAGEVGWKTLFAHSLHYEGTGGLWHSFLKGLQALHVSYWGMRWVAAAAQGAAMVVLLGWAPFPRLVRLLLPFTFFLLYQDAVVARSYCLLAVPAFAAAVLLRSARPRPILLAVLLVLLANLSVHAALLSGGLAVAGLLLWRRSGQGRLATAGLVLLLGWGVMVTTMAPAFDIDYEAGNNLRRSFAKTMNAVGIHVAAPPALGGLSAYGLPPHVPSERTRSAAAAHWRKLARALSAVTYPLSESRALALLLVGCMVAQALANRRRAGGEAGWLGLVPYGLMVLVFMSLYLAPRHAGTMLTGFVVAAWLTWPVRTTGGRRWLERMTALLLVVVCLQQIGWSAHALYKEHRLPYSPDRMTAEYLQTLPAGAPMAGYYYFSVGVLLYFDRNIYANQPAHRYWRWSTAMRTHETVQETLARRPRAVVIGGFDSGPDAEITRDWRPNGAPEPGVVLNDGFHVAEYFEEHGYHVTHVFCGHGWMRSTYAETLCDTVLEPVKAADSR